MINPMDEILDEVELLHLVKIVLLRWSLEELSMNDNGINLCTRFQENKDTFIQELEKLQCV